MEAEDGWEMCSDSKELLYGDVITICRIKMWLKYTQVAF
jgi:hypothetical protein